MKYIKSLIKKIKLFNWFNYQYFWYLIDIHVLYCLNNKELP